MPCLSCASNGNHCGGTSNGFSQFCTIEKCKTNLFCAARCTQRTCGARHSQCRPYSSLKATRAHLSPITKFPSGALWIKSYSATSIAGTVYTASISSIARRCASRTSPHCTSNVSFCSFTQRFNCTVIKGRFGNCSAARVWRTNA